MRDNKGICTICGALPSEEHWAHCSADREKAEKMKTAPGLLAAAAALMVERGAQYDRPKGERSMAATVSAYNAVTGQQITEANGWLLMALLKMVRDNQREAPHKDSIEDLVAYASLYGEARLAVAK